MVVEEEEEERERHFSLSLRSAGIPLYTHTHTQGLCYRLTILLYTVQYICRLHYFLVAAVESN